MPQLGENIRKQSRLAPSAAIWVDFIILACVLALFFGLVEFGSEWLEPSTPATGSSLILDLSLSALPKYAFMSFVRGMIAYVISLIFSLIVGGIAAHQPIAEKIIVPLLDILQGIPVLGFMPGLVIAMVSIFPNNNVGLELACILMIFTAQAWNLAFAFYGSTRSVPSEFREVARIHNFSWWKTFKAIELPYAAIPLVWNSMMSMAGGWFFLTVNEAFRLGDRDYRLPGIGSYMSLAIERGDRTAMFGAIGAMCFVIILSDRLIWNPLSVWSIRFRMDDSLKEPPSSPITRFLKKSLALRKVRNLIAEAPTGPIKPPITLPKQLFRVEVEEHRVVLRSIVKLTLAIVRIGTLVILCVSFLMAIAKLASLALSVHGREWLAIFESLGWTFLRTSACLILSVLWALPVGIVIGRNLKISQRVQPLVQLLASFPAPMLYPLVIAAFLALGINFEWGCTLLMLLGAQWYVLFNVIAGAQAIPNDLFEVSRVYKMPRFDRWTKLYIPAVFPSLLTGLVTAAGGAWNASIISEFVHYKGETLRAQGLGALITEATDSGNMPLLCAGVGVMAVFLVLINRFVWKPLFKISDQRFSMNR